MKQLTIENFKAMLDNALKNIKEREDEFSKLDAVIGDGDHGQAIVTAMSAIVATAQKGTEFKAMLNDMGFDVMLQVSGSTSTLLGAFFLGMSDHASGTELDAAGVKAMFAGGLANVQKQTKAQKGDKTMMDALIPAVEAALATDGDCAAILAAAVMLAAGVCGSLAAIGPRYCGEITVEQFAANFNRGASQLSTQNAGKLTRDGVWTSRDTNMFLLMNVPPFGYETDENGRLQSVCIEADGGAAFGARPTGLMQLALYAFAGAQKGHICFNRAIMDVTKRLKAQPQEAFSTVVDGVAVDYQYRAEGNCYRLMMTKTGVDK